ncbi:MAG: RsiV family protein [Oscillospiraceae bacterium]|jgi:hypothetical protein|nr:RsiV family protein [Oscillospiraceae bacterium]
MTYSIERETELWREEERVVLTVAIEFPLFAGTSKAIRRINKYYSQRNSKFIELCKRSLMKFCDGTEAALQSRVVFADENYISIVSDTGFSGHAESSRTADVWRVSDGIPVLLRDLLPGKAERELRKFAASELTRRLNIDPALYYPDVEKRAGRHFSAENFYISADGKITLFYQQNTVAPRSCGFVQLTVNAER